MSGYAVITPARNESESLPNLARSLIRQTVQPTRWLVVDNGSTDSTADVVRTLAREHSWIRLVQTPGAGAPRRGGAAVRAFQAGLEALDVDVDYIVNQDADITVPPGYFERLIAEFESDEMLGIAGGTCFEQSDGLWARRHVTGTTVWGGSRMYRHECLDRVLPLDERVGWDGMADAKANVAGWSTRLIADLPFLHHRAEGVRDGSWRARVAQGESAHYMGYRAWYLTLRALRNLVHGPASLGLIWGYGRAAITRQPTAPDPAVREHTREQQRLSRLPARLRETRGAESDLDQG